MTEPANIIAHWHKLSDGSQPYRVPDFKGWEHSFRTGDMIRAAQTLAGWVQAQLADAARLHPRTIRKWEAEPTPWRKGHALSRMQEALATRGVIVFLHPTPGVRYDRPVAKAKPLA
jgi:hypothetical protein